MSKVRFILFGALICLLISTNAQATRRARIVVTDPDNFILISQTLGKKQVACHLDKKGRLTPGVIKQRRQKTVWLNLKKRLRRLKRNRRLIVNGRRKYRRLKRKIRLFRRACRDVQDGPTTPSPSPSGSPTSGPTSSPSSTPTSSPTATPTEDTYTLSISAVNGTVLVTPEKQEYYVGEVIQLRPKPDNGFYFAGWGGDLQGDTLVKNLTMDSNKSVTATFNTWQPPLGIPEPEFGIHETHQMYVGQTFDFGSGPEPYKDAGNGPYTHYVDNTHPSATDSGNPYGTASVPRRTIPRDLTAGNVVEVHGGPYTYRNGGDKIVLNGDGTAGAPVFVRGINQPEFRSPFNIAGQYIIFENFYFYNAGVSIRVPGGTTELLHHISLRNNETEGDGTTSGRGGLGTGSDAPTEHIVIYNNHLHHAGDYAYPEENDRMGTGAGRDTHYLWIVDNHIHHNGGDSFQGGHSAPEGSIGNIYIGRNEMHDDGENAIDIKNVWDIIVSQNTMYSYPNRNPSSDGTITVSHYGGTAAGPQRVWFLFNEMFDAVSANQVGGGARDEIYFIGNVIHDIEENAFVSWTSRDLYFVGNTMYNVGTGIESTGSTYVATIVNNIFGKLNDPSERQISLDYSTYNNNAVVQNNLFQDPMNITPVCTNCLEGNPQFVDPANGNFHLQSTSPAESAAASSSPAQGVYDRFQQLYGIDIRRDKDGNTLTVPWDIGAYEYQ